MASARTATSATTPAASRLRMIEVNGQRIRVSTRPGSDPAAPPLVLCNGIGASLDLLQPFVDQVDPVIPVISFDVPGVGGSPLPSTPYTFPLLARLVGKMVQHLGYHRFDVLGISWGGGLAQQVALQHPRRCRRVVLVATATGTLMVPARPHILAKLITPRRYRDKDYARQVAAELYGGRVRTDPELASRLLHASSRVGPERGYLYQLLAGTGWSTLPVLPLLRQPTYILAGEDDPIIPLANARMMQCLLPHSRLTVYPDGHLGLVTMADELGPQVSDFLLAEDPLAPV